jgi:hypothetical protein
MKVIIKCHLRKAPLSLISIVSFLMIFPNFDHSYAIDLKGLQPLPPYGVFSTFSAEGLGKGKFGLALGLERSRQPDYYRITNNFGYGITDNLEFDITIPFVAGWQDDTEGFEDISIGLKYRVIDEGRYGPSMAVLLASSLNTGKEQFSTDGSVSGGLIVSKRVGPFKGHINALYSRPINSKLDDEVTLAAGVDFAASHNFKLLSELYGKKTYSGRLDHVEFRIGYRIMTAENLFTTLGIGYDIKNRSPEYRLLFSISYIFPRDKRGIKRIYEEE